MVQSFEKNTETGQSEQLITQTEEVTKKFPLSSIESAQENGDGSPKVVFESSVDAGKQLAEGDFEEDLERQSKEEKEKVPDGGYGWIIVLGSFIAHVIIGGLERNEGVYFLQFQSRYGKSAQLTAWPGAIVSTLRLSLGPVVSALCSRFSVRSSVLIGSIILTVAQICTANTPDFFFLFFSHSALQGLGAGLMYSPSVIIVGMYFDKRRGLAAGLGAAGVGVGTFCLVPLTQFLFDTVGFQATFMIIAGIALNGVVVAMLFRPLSLHYKFTRRNKSKCLETSKNEEGVPLSQVAEADESAAVKSSDSHLKESCNGDVSGLARVDSQQDFQIKNPPRREGCLKSSLRIFFPIENRKKAGKPKQKLFHFALLKEPSFLLFCCSISLFTCTFKAAFTFIPALVKSRNISESDAALVLSITGVFDTIGRIGAGLLLDLPLLRPIRPVLYNSLIFLIATIAFILPSLSSFVVLCILCSVFGILTGAYISQKSVVIVDILGVQNLTTSFGLLTFFQALGVCVGPPLAGSLRDAFGGFDEAFYLGGGCMVMAGLLMVASNIFLRIKKRRENATQAT